MNRFLLFRIIADCLLLTSLVVGPWWFTLALALVGAFVFEDFYELPVLGFGFDLLYAPTSVSGLHWQNFVGLFSGAIIFISAFLIKTRLIVYNR